MEPQSGEHPVGPGEPASGHGRERRIANDLTARTADAFERYENNRTLLVLYKEQILPSQVKAFRAALARHAIEGKVSYYDVVTAQQTLVGLISSYLGALSDQWTAVVDIAHLAQTQNLFHELPADEVTPIPELSPILPRARGASK